MSVFSFPSNFCQLLSNSAQARHGCQCHAYFQMQRYAWNWDRWWIFTFFKLLPLTTVGLSPRPTMGASFLLLGFFISLTNALVLGNFMDENKFQSQIIEIPCYFLSEEVVTSHTPNSPNRRKLHTQVNPIPRRFTLNSRTPTPRLEILWILLETLSPVSTPSPMMLIDKWLLKNLKHNRCHNNKSVFLFQFVDTELLVWPKQ